MSGLPDLEKLFLGFNKGAEKFAEKNIYWIIIGVAAGLFAIIYLVLTK